jgi:anaerobic magnesium-protoporphyrin IX monomethyl ester cyclase
VDIALLTPPSLDPRSPHLATAGLTAALRTAGLKVEQRDLAIESLVAMLSASRLAHAWDLSTKDKGAEQCNVARIRRFGKYIIEAVPGALAALRNPGSFYDPFVCGEARETIVAALEMVSAASGVVDFNIAPIRYNVAGCDPASLTDLLRVTSDPACHLFEEYYEEALYPSLAQSAPLLVGVSLLNAQQLIPGLTLARRLRKRGHFVVIGGTYFAKFVMQLRSRPVFFETFCDALVAYEGETALVSLYSELKGDRRDFSSVPNLMFLDQRGTVRQGPTHLEDVNALPTPDFYGLPLYQYLSPEPVFPIMFGKGCYFNRCKFCDIPHINHISRKAYRVRDPQRVAGDLSTLSKRYGARFFEFTDETLAPRLLLDLAEILKEQYPDLEPRFVGYARMEPSFTPETCQRLRAMGFRKIFFGLESGSQRMLDHMDKGYRIEDANEVLRNCREANIGFHLFSIVGFPEETEVDARETLDFFLRNKGTIDHPSNSFDVHPFTLDLRTEYSDRAAAFGIALPPTDPNRDFPVSHQRWKNTRGIDSDRVEELIGEFHAVLREHYSSTRRFPAHLWPSFEEYSVQYGDHYEAHPFNYRFTLDASSDQKYRLRWAPSTRVEPESNDACRVVCLLGEADVPLIIVKLLLNVSQPDTIGGFLDGIADRFDPAPDERGALLADLSWHAQALVQSGALQLVPVFDPMPN